MDSFIMLSKSEVFILRSFSILVEFQVFQVKWAQDACQYYAKTIQSIGLENVFLSKYPSKNNGNTQTIDNHGPWCWMLSIFPKIVWVFALSWKWSKVLKQTIYSCFSQYFHYYWSTYSTVNSLPPVLVEHCVSICCSVKNFLKVHIVFNPVFRTLPEINFVFWSLSDFISPHSPVVGEKSFGKWKVLLCVGSISIKVSKIYN